MPPPLWAVTQSLSRPPLLSEIPPSADVFTSAAAAHPASYGPMRRRYGLWAVWLARCAAIPPDVCQQPCRAETCGSLNTTMNCYELSEAGCSCGGCCVDPCDHQCRDRTCGELADSFTCSEFTGILGGACAGCCLETFPPPPPDPNATDSSDPELSCQTLPAWGAPLGVTMGVFSSIGINVGQNMQADGIQELPAQWRDTQRE